MRKIITFGALLALISCGSPEVSRQKFTPTEAEIAQVEEIAGLYAFNPEEVRFRGVTGYVITRENGTQERIICGAVNGENRLGGMTGFQPFITRYGTNGYGPLYISEYGEIATCG